MRQIQWLVVVDHPDERVTRHSFDHIHSWFWSEDEATVFLRLVSDRIPGEHLLVDPPAICPKCGIWPSTLEA